MAVHGLTKAAAVTLPDGPAEDVFPSSFAVHDVCLSLVQLNSRILWLIFTTVPDPDKYAVMEK